MPTPTRHPRCACTRICNFGQNRRFPPNDKLQSAGANNIRLVDMFSAGQDEIYASHASSLVQCTTVLDAASSAILIRCDGASSCREVRQTHSLDRPPNLSRYPPRIFSRSRWLLAATTPNHMFKQPGGSFSSRMRIRIGRRLGTTAPLPLFEGDYRFQFPHTYEMSAEPVYAQWQLNLNPTRFLRHQNPSEYIPGRRVFPPPTAIFLTGISA